MRAEFIRLANESLERAIAGKEFIIPTPIDREETAFLANMAVEQLKMVQQAFDATFARCEAAQKADKCS